MEERNEILLAAIKNLLKKNEMEKVTTILNKIYPADSAEIVGALPEADRKRIFEAWDIGHSADTLPEMDEDEQVDLAESLSTSLVADILEEMPADDAADLLGDMKPESAERVFSSMEPKKAVEVRQLLKHEEKTAGGLMTPDFISVSKDIAAQEAIEVLRKLAPKIEGIYYVFAVNEEEQLVGVIPLRQLIIASPDTPIKKIMNPDVIYVGAGVDQEEVAKLMSKYDLLALPVVGHNHELLGIVTIDDVVDVIEDEATEDIYKLSGTLEAEEADISGANVLRAMRVRLPWLLMALVGEVLFVGFIADRFKSLLEYLPALVVFWAAMTAIGGNMAIQTSTIIIRGLALSELNPREISIRIFREMRLSLLIGLVSAALLFVVAIFWQGAMVIGVTVAIAAVVIILTGALVGSLAPVIFQRMGFDPAASSGPFLTCTMDAASLFLYFFIALLVLRAFHAI